MIKNKSISQSPFLKKEFISHYYAIMELFSERMINKMISNDLETFSHGKPLHNERIRDIKLTILFLVLTLGALVLSKQTSGEPDETLMLFGTLAVLGTVFFGIRVLWARPVVYEKGIGFCWFKKCLRFNSWEGCHKIEVKTYYPHRRHRRTFSKRNCHYQVFFYFDKMKPIKVEFPTLIAMVHRLQNIFENYPELKQRVKLNTLDLEERKALKEAGFPAVSQL